jgi:hypothetical protein
MLGLTHHHSRLASEFSEHPTRTRATIGGFVLLTLATIGALWLMPEIKRYIRMVRM